nr:PREDICTED: thyrotropin-releasing hormone-degrading ectoenzyme-like isoform X1 [Linepithema humile]
MKISMAFRHILLNVGLILILIIILFTAKLTKNETELNYNVFNDTYLKALHYNVKIKFDVYRNVFFGKCNIIIQINRAIRNITMISSKIFGIVKIDLIDNNDNQTINIQKFSFIDKTYIYFDFIQSSVDLLSPGTYILKMIYVSSILDDGDFFESFDIVKEKDKLLNKVIRAGELFPYLDEPVFKSTFKISIWHHENYTFLSSMPIQKQVEDMDNMLWTHFDTSPPMSVESLTIVMTTFNYSAIYLTSIANMKIWCRKEITEQIRYAKTIAQGVVHYLAQKNTRKISKINYIVIKDFQHFNIKTRGFILLREEDIIYNNTLDDIARKIKVANLVARETISQWYDDVFLWSKEGFITFLAAHILNQTRLYDRMMDLFVVQTQQESLRFDMLPTDSLPLRTSFYYIKSSIIWRMLYHLIRVISSDNVFWTGIHTYIDIQYNQSNTIQIDQLWNVIQIILNNRNLRRVNITDIMNIWIKEKRYPQLLVNRIYVHNKTVYREYINSKFNKNARHFVLVTCKTKSNDYNYFWLYQQKSRITKKKNDKNDWIIVNLKQAGYYRVNYDFDNWQKLAIHLYYVNYTDIHVLNRAQIIDDAFYFLTQKQLNFTMFWDITRFLHKDTDYVAWYPMIKAVEYMTCVWAVQDTSTIKNNIREIFDKLLLNIGYNDKLDESDFTKCLREEAVKWACVLGSYKCRQTAAFQLEKHFESSAQDKFFKWREWIYCKGLMTASYTIWTKILLRHTSNITYDNIYLEYLTCYTNPHLIQSYLTAILNGFYSRVANNQTIANIVLLIVAKHSNNDAVLNYILNSFELFQFNIKKPIDQIAILIVIITHEHDVKQLTKINEFVKNNITMSEKQLINAVKLKIKKRKLEYKRSRNYGRLSAPTV